MISLLSGGMLAGGCSKEPVSPAASASQPNLRARIESFIAAAREARNGVAKDGGTSAVADAVWDIEAALNYEAGDLAKHWNDIAMESVSVPLDMSNGQADASAIYAAYNAALAIVAPLTTAEQHVILIDVVEPEPGADALEVFYQIGSGYDKGAPNNSYGVNDDHWWGIPTGSSGTCPCGTNGNSNARCANKEIEYRINAANLYALGPNDYLTDVETWNVNRNATSMALKRYNYLDPVMASGETPGNDGYHDTKTFYWNASHPSGNTCLQEGEMSYWTGTASTGTWSAITMIKGIHCPTKTFLSSTSAAYQWTPPGSTARRIHEWSFTFGRINSGSNG